MGCNTSQELKTKDSATSTGNGDGDHGMNPLDAAMENADQNINTCGSQKCLNSAESKHERKSSGSSTKHHNKVDSLLSNGDAIKCSLDDALASVTSNGYSAKRDSLKDANHDSYSEEEAAATKIQAAFRGHKTRATMKKAEAPVQSAHRDQAAHQHTGHESGADEPTQEEIEAAFDLTDKDLNKAALKIQSTFRGHLTRKLNADAHPTEHDIKEITRKVAEELDIDLSDPELNKAATKIQASFRGHKTRKVMTHPE